MAKPIKPHNVYDDYQKAKIAEEICTHLLRSWGWYVTDVSKDIRFRAADIDMLCHRRREEGGVEVQTVESKTDSTGYETGNFCFEDISNTNKGTPGWALYTRAKYICIQQERYLYILEGAQLVEWFSANYHRFKQITTATNFYTDDKTRYYSKCRIVPRKTYDKEVGIVATIDLQELGLWQPTKIA